MAVGVRPMVAALDEELSTAQFTDGMHNGLQVEGRPTISRLITAVSVSSRAIAEATSWNADAILTHHGLLWNNQPLHIQGVRRKRLRGLLDGELNLISYHLPLDAHPSLGNNAALADAAGCTKFDRAFPMNGAPIGVIGSLPPTPFSAWAKNFEASLRADCAVATGPFAVWPFGPEKVERIGFVSGAAPYAVQDAIDDGLDAFVTGETTEGVYHLAREAGIHFIGAGHYLTERFGVQRLGEWVAQRFGVAHRFVDVETLA